MIKIIYGAKGTGKTKQLINAANDNVKDAKGLSVFITDNCAVAGEEALCGFVKGVAACNSDHEYIYIDGVSRITGKGIKELAGIFYMLDKIAGENDITVTVTCSCDESELPDFVKRYV